MFIRTPKGYSNKQEQSPKLRMNGYAKEEKNKKKRKKWIHYEIILVIGMLTGFSMESG